MYAETYHYRMAHASGMVYGPAADRANRSQRRLQSDRLDNIWTVLKRSDHNDLDVARDIIAKLKGDGHEVFLRWITQNTEVPRETREYAQRAINMIVRERDERLLVEARMGCYMVDNNTQR